MFSPISSIKIGTVMTQPSEGPVHSPGSRPQQISEPCRKSTPKPSKPEEEKGKQETFQPEPKRKTNYPNKVQQSTVPRPKSPPPPGGKASQCKGE